MIRWLAFVAVCAALLWCARDRLSQDLLGLLPDDDPALARQIRFFADAADARVLAVEGPRQELESLPPLLAPLGAVPAVDGDPARIARAAGIALAHLPELTPPGLLAERLEPAALVERLRGLKQRLARPDDVASATVARIDPLGLSGAALAPLAPAGSEAVGALRRHADGEHWMLPLAVAFPPEDLGRTRALLDAIAAHAPASTVVGPYRHYRENLDTVKRDLNTTLPASLVLVAAMLWSLLGSLRGGLILHVPAALGLLASAATAAAWSLITGRTIPLPILAFAAALLGVAVDYGTHTTCAMRHGGVAVVRRPLILSYLTTATAFAVLLTSSVPGLRLLALLVITGLGTALIAALTLLPRILPALPERKPWHRLSTALLGRSEPPWRRLAAAAVLTALLAPGLAKLTTESDLRRFDGSAPGTWPQLTAFLDRWGGLDTSNALVVDAASADEALAAHAQARRALDLPVPAIEALLPDTAEQGRRRSAWNTAVADLPQRFAAACREAGLRPAGFDLGAYAAVDPGRSMLTGDDWAGTPLAILLGSQLRALPDGQWRVATPMPRSEADPPPPAWIAARTRIGAGLVRAVRDDLTQRIPVIAGVILLLVLAVERSARTTAAVLLPSVLALAWTFGLLGWLGQPLTPFSLLVAAFMVGIGIDSALFLASGQGPHAVPPVLVATATTIAGVGTLVFAHHPLIRSMGISLTIGMTSCLVACLLVTPGLAHRRDRA